METNPNLISESVIDLLQLALEVDPECQRMLDQRKRAFEVVNEYPFVLLDIAHGKHPCDLTIRHMASIFLKNFVSTYAQLGDVIEKPDIFEEQLLTLTRRLMNELHHENRSINAILVETLVTLSLMGYWKYIENDVYTTIKTDNDEVRVKTCLQFFAELLISERVSEAVIEVDEDTYTKFLQLYQGPTPTDIKFILIDILCESIVRPFFENRIERERLLITLIPVLTRTIYNSSNEHNFPLQSKLLERLAICVSHSVVEAYNIFLNLMPSIGQLLLQCCSEFKAIILNTSGMDGENKTSLCILIESLLGFLYQLFVSNEYRPIIFVDLADIFYCITIFVCFTNERDFKNSLSLNYDELDEEHEDFDSLVPRSSALSLFSGILPHVKDEKLVQCFSSLHLAHEKLLNENNASSILYYRIVEAIMTILYEIKKRFPKNKFFSNDQLFTQRNYFNAFTQLFINDDEHYIILGRLFLFVSIYSASADAETVGLHIRGILARLNSAGDVGTSWFLATALRNHLTCVPISPEDNRNVFGMFADEIARCLLKYSQLIYLKPELYLPSLGNLINCNQMVAITNKTIIDEIIRQCIKLHYQNVNKIDQIAFLLSCIARHGTICPTIYTAIVPFLVRLISMQETENLDDVLIIPETALDLLNTIAIYAAMPLENHVLKTVFLIIHHKIKHNELELVHNGCTFITIVVLKYLHQLSQMNDNDGIPLTNYLVDILMELLENAKLRISLNISRLCVVLITTLSDRATINIDVILKYVVTTLQVYDMTNTSAINYMITIFFAAFMVHPQQSINFLASLPGPLGGNAISFIFKLIDRKYLTTSGLFEKIFFGMAIMKILRNLLEVPNPRMLEVTSLYDHFGKEGNGIEFLYVILVTIFVENFDDSNNRVFPSNDEENDYFYSTKTYHRYDEERHLFSYHEFSSIDIKSEILNFFSNETSMSYLSLIVNKFIFPKEVVQILINLGLPLTMPQYSEVPMPMGGIVEEEQAGPSDAPME